MYKMNQNRNLLLVFSFLYLFGGTVFSESRYIFLPAKNEKWVIIGQDRGSIDEYIRAFKIVPDGFMVYTSIQGMEGLDSPVDYGAGVQHFQALVDQYPESTFIQIGLHMVGGLKGVISGDYDENVEKLADWINTSKQNIFLRIGYEFDFPQNQYDPDLYVQAYRCIVDKLREKNVQNVAYVWHSYGSSHEPIEKWYPGDEYVDWCGVSYFRPKRYPPKILEFAKDKNKPIMIAEAAPQGMRTSKDKAIWNRWYKGFFDFIEEYNIQAVSYINANWEEQAMWKGQGWGDSRVQMDPKLKKQWLSQIKSWQP